MIYGFISALSRDDWIGKIISIIPLIFCSGSIFIKINVFLYNFWVGDAIGGRITEWAGGGFSFGGTFAGAANDIGERVSQNHLDSPYNLAALILEW